MTQQFEEVEANIVLSKGQPTGYYVQIEGKGDAATIQIFYTDINDKQVKRGRKFQVGDTAEWGAYIHRFMGRILKITQNTVTVSHSRFGSGRGSDKRMKLAKFCAHNFLFDEAEAKRSNDIESQNR